MNLTNRPFKGVIQNILGILLFITIGSFFAPSPYIPGIFLSIVWALISYGTNIDLPNTSQQDRAGKAALGFFFLVGGIVVAAIGPSYLNTQLIGTDWLVMLGLFFGIQVGLSLLLASPLKSLSFWCGYMALAIILHSAILRFPNEFGDITAAKALVLTSLIISSWFLGVWLFFNNSELENFEETKKSKQAKSIIGIFSGLLTVVEFINILYTLTSFR
jgi:hypothetical protein